MLESSIVVQPDSYDGACRRLDFTSFADREKRRMRLMTKEYSGSVERASAEIARMDSVSPLFSGLPFEKNPETKPEQSDRGGKVSSTEDKEDDLKGSEKV